MKKRPVHTENILKDKIQGHEFPFDPGAWSSMQQLLDQTETPADNMSGIPKTKHWSAMSVTRWVGYFGVFALLFLAAKYYTGNAVAENQSSFGLTMEETTHASAHKMAETSPKTQYHTHDNSERNAVTLKNEGGDAQNIAKSSKSANIHREKEEQSIHMGLTEDSDHPGTEREDQKHSSALLLYHLLGVKPTHSTFENIEDFYVPDDAIQAPLNSWESQDERFSPENYKTEKNNTRSILLPEIESWQERAKKTKPSTQIKSPQAHISPKTGKQIQLGLLLGAQAMSLERSRRDTRLQPAVGVAVSAPLGKKWSAEVDLMWKNVSGYHFYATFADSGYANGGFARWEYSVASENIHFFEIPVAIKYSTAHQKQNLIGGVRFSRVRPNDYIQYFSVTNARLPMEDYIGDIGNGFRRWDAALFLGADVKLWKNLWLDIRYSRGLYDLTDNTYFKNTRADIASDAQITLKYNFARLRIPSR